ncbi:MAG: iron-sulfur cluster assembly scaffold protein [bacterium]
MDFDKFDDYVKKDTNNREIDDPDGVGVHNNEGCADNYTIYLKVTEDGIIEDSSYQTDGCPFGKASCEITTELVSGMSLEQAEDLDTDAIEEVIDGYPPRRRTYPQQVLTALRKALNNYDSNLATPVDDPVEPLDDDIEVPQ